jgi:hypothetical protein
MAIEGTASAEFVGGGLPRVSVSGAGVASVNPGTSAVALHTLVLAGGISGIETVPVTDPEVAAVVDSIQLQAGLGAGTLSPFSAATPMEPYLIQNQIPIRGTLRLCLLFVGCAQSLDVPLTDHSGQTGLGVGGSIIAGSLSNQVAVTFLPWTIGTTSIPITTTSGAMVSWPTVGWVHGPLSFSGSTALTGGALKLVSPVQILSPLLGKRPAPVVATLRLRFVPEPDLACLLGAGAIGLFLIGRRRQRPRRS